MSKQEIIIQNNCLFQLVSLLLFHLRYTPYLALAPKRTVPSLSTLVYECITQYLNHWVILLHVHQLQLLNTMNCHFFSFYLQQKDILFTFHCIILLPSVYECFACMLSVYCIQCTLKRPEEGTGTLGTGLQMVVSHLMSAGTLKQVLWNRSQYP